MITVHLREDRRHIQDRDVRILKETAAIPLNLEMAIAEEVVQFALETTPFQATLVPEKREELTTEGGLDVVAGKDRVEEVIRRLHNSGIPTALFIDPDEAQIEVSKRLSADAVEIHTGGYADAPTPSKRESELDRIRRACQCVRNYELGLHVGHGLTYRNVQDVARIPGIEEFHIGHSVVSRAVIVGMRHAVREMKDLLTRNAPEA
jgi:pyridoxine 5-phosphate synthase